MLEQTCVVCRHIFYVFWLVWLKWRISEFRWHKYTKRKYFYEVIVSDKPLEPVLSSPHCHPTCTLDELSSYLLVNEPRTEGIPVPGVKSVDDDGNHDGGSQSFGQNEDDEQDANQRQSRRTNGNAQTCDQKLGAIIHHLGTPAMNPTAFQNLSDMLASFMVQNMSVEAIHESIKVMIGPSRNRKGWNGYHDRLDRHLTLVSTTAPGSAPGRPVTKRTLAAWERHQSNHKRPSSEGGEATPATSSQRPVVGLQPLPIAEPDKRPFGWCINFEGRKGKAAIDYLARWGAMDTWIVEVYPDDKHIDYIKGDRWFMTITNGKVQGPEGDQYITACRWNKKNSPSELDSKYPGNQQCELRQVKGYGPPKCAIFD